MMLGAATTTATDANVGAAAAVTLVSSCTMLWWMDGWILHSLKGIHFTQTWVQTDSSTRQKHKNYKCQENIILIIITTTTIASENLHWENFARSGLFFNVGKYLDPNDRQILQYPLLSERNIHIICWEQTLGRIFRGEIHLEYFKNWISCGSFVYYICSTILV